MDHLTHAEPSVIESFGLSPGGMTLVDIAATELIRSVLGDGRLVPGGTVTNTAVGVASFGGSPAFVGAVATDELGDRYAADLEACGVHAALQRFPADPDGFEAATGRCYVIVTPDAERTMATALGVGGQLDSRGIDPEVIEGADLVYFDGYVLDLPDAPALVAKLIDAASRARSQVALGLADAALVERHRGVLEGLVADDVDFVFANEAELLALTRSADVKEALASVRRPGLVTAATRGTAGVVVGSFEEVVDLPAMEVVEVVDVTGAGDLFAAGFCFGITHGQDPIGAARLGTLAASEVICHLGARPQESLAELMNRQRQG
jgi:sugar/nucleoside kinase (ribokinase family)